MSKNLVIVESPAKAKTIEKYLGADYHVLSSQGHIRDIEGAGKNNIGIDFDHNYRPNYVISPQKEHIINELSKEVKKADVVWLASDEDREGEAIAWHLQEVLNLKKKTTHRIVFHEITKAAIQQAILEPRDIDYNLVNAQQARRVLDRIVGFELSPVLWKKISTGLSAGRVQSVAVRLIVEREREIEEFVPVSSYKITADFTGCNPGDASVLHTELNHRFDTKEEAQAFLEQCINASFKIASVQRKPVKRSPAPPFTTSLLQQEAARKLHFSVSKTMRLAQSLYEAGHITYMRTDSVNLSTLAIATAKQEILDEYGVSYHKARQFHTSSKGAQEAHEAIRPTYMNTRSAGANADERALYELIWRRTLACQMADAEIETTRMEVSISNSDYLFVATGEVVLFEGFMKAYVQSSDDTEEQLGNLLPRMALGERLRQQLTQAQQTYTKAPYRYNDATLVKKMEELGIGRPSTYATIIETIQTRKYVERGTIVGQKREYNILTCKAGKITDKTKQEVYGADAQKFIPTDLGRVTNDFLVEQFPAILSYDFTASEEENLDRIAEGSADWVKTVDDFYKTFHPMLEHVPSGKINGRDLGVDPTTGLHVYARISRLGPCVQLGEAEQDKPIFASLQRGQSIYTITLDEALQLFQKKLPFTLGELDGEAVIIGEGKYGLYLRVGDTYISLPRNTDPAQVTLDDARTLLSRNEEMSKPIAVFADMQVLRGRYGAYIKAADGNYKIPYGTDPASLTEEACRAIIAAAKQAPKDEQKRTFRRKSKK